ncbi:ricin-type beta-trefoil lectin domain protein [Streptomyces sp. NPDC001262]|uniref:RICIN domain-containing protein n=1 Tax=Streptomyces sp. NPDC001262 TaxID=3364552 RepID=UPI003693FBEF
MKNIKKRVLDRLAIAAVIAPLAVVGVSGEASARDGEKVSWRNVATGRCLNHNGSSEVFTSRMSDCNASRPWTEHAIREDAWGQGIYRFSFLDRCLDSSDGGKVYLNPCNKSDYQMWDVTKFSSGKWRLINVATGLVLDSSDAGRVYTKPDNGGSYQRWT